MGLKSPTGGQDRRTVSEGQGWSREAPAEGSPEQTREPTNRNAIQGSAPGRAGTKRSLIAESYADQSRADRRSGPLHSCIWMRPPGDGMAFAHGCGMRGTPMSISSTSTARAPPRSLPPSWAIHFAGDIVSDGYAVYDAIIARWRQTCLAHLIRTAKEIAAEIQLMEKPEPYQPDIAFANAIAGFFSTNPDTSWAISPHLNRPSKGSKQHA